MHYGFLCESKKASQRLVQPPFARLFANFSRDRWHLGDAGAVSARSAKQLHTASTVARPMLSPNMLLCRTIVNVHEPHNSSVHHTHQQAAPITTNNDDYDVNASTLPNLHSSRGWTRAAIELEQFHLLQ